MHHRSFLSSSVFIRVHLWFQIAAASFAAIAMLPATAAATSTGIFGNSGRFGGFCPVCHSGGTVPVVEFETPDGTQFSVGAMATFRFKITSQDRQQTHAGLDVAVSGGTLGLSDPGTKLLGFGANIEVTHTAPRENDGNDVAVFEFTWTAPATPGTYTLFGAGNSVNFNQLQTGDNAARTTLAINVVAMSTPTPTPTEPQPTDTSTPTSTATTEPTAGATPTATFGGGCTGDCDSSVSVTVDEIVRGVNIALGSRPVEDCLPFDRDGSGTVTVDEIVEAIGNALNGCG